MPDAISPVGTMYSQQNPIAALSSIYGLQQQQLDIARGKQALQTGQYTQQSAQAAAQQAQQDAGNRQAAQKFFQNFDIAKHAGTDGTVSLDSAMADPGFRQLGDATPLVLGQLTDIKNKQLDGIQKMAQIGGTVRSQAIDYATGMQRDKDVQAGNETGKGKVIDSLTDFVKSSPPAAQEILAPLIERLKSSKASDIPASLKNLTLQNQQAEKIAQATLPAAGTMDRGGSTDTGMQDPITGAFTQNQNFRKTTTPGIYTLPNKQLGEMGGGAAPPPTSAMSPQFFRPPSSGAPTTPAPPGGGESSTSRLAPLTRPAANAPGADQENYNSRIAQAGQEYGAVSQAANDPMNGVQATRFRNQQVLDLAPHAGTGPGMKIMNTLASRLPGSTGDAYQDLEHYAAQNSASLAKLMGVPGTNLGAETAAAAAGNVERNPGALMEITRTNDALNTAMDLYNRGLSKVTNNGSDMSRAASFKQAFGQNMDVNAIRWADAHRRGDTQEIQQLQQKLGPRGIAAATQKLAILKSLASKGDLP